MDGPLRTRGALTKGRRYISSVKESYLDMIFILESTA